MDSNQGLLLATLATTAIGHLVQLFREKRNREWDLRDRAKKDAVMAEKVKVEANRVADVSKQHTESVLDEIKGARKELQQNTEISVEAFREANAVNLKLLKIHDRIDEVAEQKKNAVEG